jgi:hypothetical protein
VRFSQNVLAPSLVLAALAMGCNSNEPTVPVSPTPPKDGPPASAKATAPGLPTPPTGANK